MKRLDFLTLLATAASTAGGCAVYTEDLLDGPGSGGTGNGGDGGSGGSTTTEAGPGGSSGNGAGGDSNCMLKEPPPPPEADDPDTDGDLPPLVFVQETVDLGDSMNNPTDPPRRFLEIGFDLDGRCTTPANAEDSTSSECRRPDWARNTIDGENGIDNSLGAIIQSVRNLVSDFTSENYTAQIKQGKSSVIIRLSDWNGQPNDTQVQLDVLIAAPFDSFRDAGAEPEWMGEDVWPVASDSVVDGNINQARFSDRFAYVTDYKLVANLDESRLRLDVALSMLGNVKLEMNLTSAVSVCELESVPYGSGWRAKDCVLGGRWPADQLVQQLSQFPDPSTGTNAGPLCVSSPLYPELKGNICRAIDVYDGNPTIASVCDSISMGVGFDTQPGLIDNVYTLPRVTPRCPTNVEPERDACDPADSLYDFTEAGTVIPSGTGGVSGSGGTGGTGGSGGSTGSGGMPSEDAGTDASQ